MNPDLRYRQLDPTLLGKIVLARFLELSLRRFDQFVQQLESEPMFARLSEFVATSRIPDAKMASKIDPDSMTLGEIAWSGGTPELLYHSPSFIREYRLKDEIPERDPLEGDNGKKFSKTLHRLRLVNTRNRLTHVLVRLMISWQAAYLRTGDPTLLLPLTQKQISEELRTGGLYSGVADPSRISRLVRNIGIRDREGGRIITLSELAPSSRKICCHFIAHVIRNEKLLTKEDRIAALLTDKEISERVSAEFGVQLSKRTVSYVRREIGIPAGRERRAAGLYHEATADFSPPMSLSLSNLRETVPNESGVYEIRSFIPGAPEVIVYIGSSGNLRKRLAHHLTGSGNNLRLREKIAGGARFRYQVFKGGWRNAEREIYRTYCSTFGAPPECNRMSP